MKRLIALTLLLSTPAWGLDLQTKPRNTDRRTFVVNPGARVEENKWTVFGEFNSSSKPLVSRGIRTGNTTSLVDNLYSIEIGGNYGLTDAIQLGLLLPLDLPSGVLEGGSFLNGPYLEAKFKLSDNFAIIPSYQMSSKGEVTVSNEGTRQTFILGAPSGTFGARVVGEMGSVDKAFGAAAYLGYYHSPDNVFATIDQTSRIAFGASAGIPLSNKVNGLLEFYGDKTPSNTALELMGFIKVKESDFNWLVGAGTGNLQFSGSNVFKATLGVNFSFGGDAKKNRGMNYVPATADSRRRQRTPQRIEFAPIPQQEQGGQEEQTVPAIPEVPTPTPPSIPDVEERDQSSLNKPGRILASNSIIIETKDNEVIHVEDPLEKVVGEKKSVTKKPKAVVKKAPSTKLMAKKTKTPLFREVVLPNGQKARVFKDKVTQLPTEPHLVYLTEADYQKLLQQAPAVVGATPDLDPEPSLGPLEVQSENLPTTPLIVVEGTQEKMVAPTNQKVEVLEKTVNPLPTVGLSPAKLKTYLEAGFDQPLEVVPTKNPIEVTTDATTEAQKLEAEMQRQQAEAAAKIKAEADAALAARRAAENERIRREAPLTESGQLTYGRAATEQELRAVRIKDGTKLILPTTKANAFMMNRPMENGPAVEGDSSDLLLENGAPEETLGPDYGLR